MTPIYFGSQEDIDAHTEVIVKAVLLIGAAIGIAALALIVLASIHFTWLRYISWCNAEFSPVVCSLYLAGI